MIGFEEKNQINYVNIMKAIGIISVVIGHASVINVTTFVYTYHLAVFFFLSGFLYNEEKYAKSPFLNLANRFKSLYGKYVFFALVIGCLKNSLISLGVYPYEKFTFFWFKNYILNSLVFINTEPLLGAMWFVQALLCASILFGFIIYWSSFFNDSCLKFFFIVSMVTVCALLGMERFKVHFDLFMRLDVALFVMPIILIGYYCGKNKEGFLKILKLPFALISIGAILFFIKKFNIDFDLVSQRADFKLFIITSLFGIYLVAYSSIVLSKFKLISHVLNYIGKNTFSIMALHFLCFKILDYIISVIKNEQDVTIIAKFPHSYSLMLGGGYVCIGVLIPVVLCLLKDFFVQKLVNKGLVK